MDTWKFQEALAAAAEASWKSHVTVVEPENVTQDLGEAFAAAANARRDPCEPFAGTANVLWKGRLALKW